MKKMQDQVVMITGAGGCIGRCTAALFAREGARLILCDRTQEALAGVTDEVTGLGAEAIACPFDVRSHEGAVEAVQKGLERFGRIDALIAVAGGSAALLGKLSTFADSQPETWDFVMGINVQGSFNCVHAVLPHMLERKSGRIILFGSIAGVGGLAGRADYSAAKGALSSFTRALAMEVGAYNITVNCVSPGAIHRDGVPIEGMTYMGPRGESAGPEPVAAMCLFLASQDGWFITGQNYQVDGGRTLGSLKHTT